MFALILEELIVWIEAVVSSLPGRSGAYLRKKWFSQRLASAGSSLSVGRGCFLHGVGRMDVGDFVSIGDRCNFTAAEGMLRIGSRTNFNANVFIGADFGEVTIGKDVLVAMNVVFRAANHRTDRTPVMPIREQGHEAKPIQVGDDVWIGANAVILAGAKIGDHCVIGAGSVVTGEIPPCSLAVGVPARVVRKFEAEDGTVAEPQH